jgi:GWxTD domain-containing protein
MRIKNGKQEVETERLFTMRWEGVPASIADLTLAIQQMRYIAKKDDLKKILDVDTEKQREAFLGFWRRIDPSPGTEQNELLDEYYRRITYASLNFGGVQEGWKSDRGMVFVLFGAPNDIERNPFNRSPRTAIGRARTVKAFEIWTYYEINRQFVFLDESGYGDFRLEYPFAIDRYLR